MKVLIACEESGRVRNAFLRRGHSAVSCDLLPSASPGPHIQGDVLEVLDAGWDMIIAFPPCTYVATSGIHWNNRIPGRREKTEEAVAFFLRIWGAPSPRIAIENPVGVIPSKTGVRWHQKIQPWEYGHPESKLTCLWLKGLPPLRPTNILTPTRFQKNGSPLWNNQTPTGQNKLGPSPMRARLRGYTYPGIADAMADQWGAL